MTLGETGESTQLGGYCVLTADDLQAAVALAKQPPPVTRGGVEVGVLAALRGEHPAEQTRARLANS